MYVLHDVPRLMKNISYILNYETTPDSSNIIALFGVIHQNYEMKRLYLKLTEEHLNLEPYKMKVSMAMQEVSHSTVTAIRTYVCLKN